MIKSGHFDRPKRPAAPTPVKVGAPAPDKGPQTPRAPALSISNRAGWDAHSQALRNFFRSASRHGHLQ
jgi:hypothetical protein